MLNTKYNNNEDLQTDAGYQINAALELSEELKEEKEINLTVIAQSKNVVKFKNEYVMLFVRNLSKLIKDYKLTFSEMRVILKLLELMEFGNQITITQKAICEELEMKKSNVSAIYRSLQQKNIMIIDERGCIYFNPNIAVKGLAHRMKKDKREKLKEVAKTSSSINSAYN